MDLLRTLFEMQQELLPALDVEIPDGDCLDSPMFWPVAIGLSTEASELLDAAAVVNKPWKSVDREIIHKQMREELVDTLFMLMEVALFLHMDADDLVDAYLQKYQKNLHRILQSTEVRVSIKQKNIAMTLLKRMSERQIQLANMWGKMAKEE